MAGGSVEPEADTDQQCPHCDRYFSNRGINSHEASCPGRADDDEDPAPELADRDANGSDDDTSVASEPRGSGATDESPADRDATDESPETVSSNDVEEEIPADGDQLVTCPECGNQDDGNEPHIYHSDESLRKHFAKHGQLTPERDGLIRANDLFCWSCGSVWSVTADE